MPKYYKTNMELCLNKNHIKNKIYCFEFVVPVHSARDDSLPVRTVQFIPYLFVIHVHLYQNKIITIINSYFNNLFHHI